MLNKKKNNNTFLSLDSNITQDNCFKFDKYLSNNKNQNMTVDITSLNMLDACEVSMLCSTSCYIKSPETTINWLVNNPNIQKLTSSMNIGNSNFYTV